MKTIVTLFSACLFALSTSAQSTWTWLNGEKSISGYGVYGTKLIPDSANIPGARNYESSNVDKYGNIWIFGGEGFSRKNGGFLNDLWRFDAATSQWTWISGQQYARAKAEYGIKGVSSPANRPQPRMLHTSWIDNSGNFWVYGGRGLDTSIAPYYSLSSYFSDVWKFSPVTNEWTWVSGNKEFTGVQQTAIHGQKKAGTTVTYPGSRVGPASVTDSVGNLLLFGGISGRKGPNSSGNMNDLWQYNISAGIWNWIAGDSTSGEATIFGTKGLSSVTSKPGARLYASNWIDAEGNYWIFGGTSEDGSRGDYNNEVWRFSFTTNQWTWIHGDNLLNSKGLYGQRNISNPETRPSSRARPLLWKDSLQNIWLYGGFNKDGELYDTWKYSMTQNQWTWVSGDTVSTFKYAVFGKKGAFSDSALPPSNRFNTPSYGAAVAQNSGTALMWAENGIWKYSQVTNQWAWLSSDTNYYQARNGLSNPSSQEDSTQPSARYLATTWRGADNKLWLFGGGAGPNSGTIRSDLWNFDPSANKWKRLIKDGLPTVFGQLGQPSDSAHPFPRYGGTSWVDKSGNFWLFSGNYYVNASFNDLWKYNPNTLQWTPIRSASGSTATYPAPVGNGTVATAGPGPQTESSSFVDSSGKLWLFGGRRGTEYFNALWRFDPATTLWEFRSGNREFNGIASATDASYGAKGVPGSSTINGRAGATSWTDAAGNFWLFGGASSNRSQSAAIGEQLFYNDLWKYSVSTGVWTWVSGNNTTNQPGLYLGKGITTANTVPAARAYASGWTDNQGNFYLFGGRRDSSLTYSVTYYYNDLWKYSIASNRWTLIGGDSTVNNWGDYRSRGVASPQNQPGGTQGASAWQDALGNGYIFGGYGYTQNGFGPLNSVLKFSPEQAPLPVVFSAFAATKKENFVKLNWTTSQELNSRAFIIERASDGVSYSSIGTVNASGNTNWTTSYFYDDNQPLAGANYYRLKQIDKDNSFIYSAVKKVDFILPGLSMKILQNPVGSVLRINLYTPSSQNVLLQITDAKGQLVLSRKYSANTGTNNLQVDVSTLVAGTYFIELKSGTSSLSKTFLKK